MKRLYSNAEKQQQFCSAINKPVQATLDSILKLVPWSIPSLRPKPHPLITQNVARFIKEREYIMQDEYFINDEFTSLLHFQKSPAAEITYNISHPYIKNLWKDGGKELITHFFPDDTLWDIKVLLDTSKDDAYSKTVQIVLNVEKIKKNNSFEAESYAQRIGFIHFFFLTAPIFKAFRRAFYGLLKLDTEVKVRLDEIIWLQYKNDTFICCIWDKRTNLDPQFHHFVRNIVSILNSNLKYLSAGKLPPGSTKLKKLTDVFTAVAPYLKFSYKTVPPRFVIERFKRKNLDPNIKGFKYTTEVELLSMAKTVFGVMIYLEYAHRYSKELFRLSCKQAVQEIISQAALYEHPTILDQQANSSKSLFCVP